MYRIIVTLRPLSGELVEMHRCDTWRSVKAYLLASGTRHAFVTRDADKAAWNVSLSDKGRMRADLVRPIN